MRHLLKEFLPEITYIVVFSVSFLIFFCFLLVWLAYGIAIVHPYISFMIALGSLFQDAKEVISLKQERKKSD